MIEGIKQYYNIQIIMLNFTVDYDILDKIKKTDFREIYKSNSWRSL